MSKTTIGRRGADDPTLIKARRAELIALGYPWPENLDDKLLWWLEAELKAMTRQPGDGARYRQKEMNSNAKWTADDDGRLLELKTAGKSDRAIADTLKRSAAAVEQRLYLLRDRFNNSPQ